MSAVQSSIDLEALLTPIAGDSPAGRNLEYEDVYRQIRALRNPGELEEPSPEDWMKVIRIAAEALEMESKDLQLSIWLLEALTHADSFAGTAAGLDLTRRIAEEFWDGCFPEIDTEDDEEPLAYRAGPLEWISGKLPSILKGLPLCAQEYGLVHYEVTQASSDVRQAFVEQGWPDSEQFSKALESEGLARLESTLAAVTSALACLDQLESMTDKRFVEKREAASGSIVEDPILSFSGVREVLEECRWLVEKFAKPKRTTLVEEKPSDELVQAEPSEQRPQPAPQQLPQPEPVGQQEDSSSADRVSAEPVGEEDARQRVFLCADYLRQNSPYHPAPFIIKRAIALGDALFYDDLPDPDELPAPAPELRQRLETLSQNQEWQDLLDECEKALETEANWYWLDLHRYAVTAMSHLNEDYFGRPILAIRGVLRTLLEGHPGLVKIDLGDEQPAADQETRRWLSEEILSGNGAGPSIAPAALRPEEDSASEADERALKEARRLAKGKEFHAVIQLLQDWVAASGSGRVRFRRRLLMAQLFMEYRDLKKMAYPILDELALLIERHRLQDWEEKELVAGAWRELVRCGRDRDIKKAFPDGEARASQAYQQLCRFDLASALGLD